MIESFILLIGWYQCRAVVGQLTVNLVHQELASCAHQSLLMFTGYLNRLCPLLDISRCIIASRNLTHEYIDY